MDRARLLKHFDTLADTPDAVAKLRELISSLAVRGQLLPLDTNRLPNTQLPELETPIPCPLHWEWKPFGDLLEFGPTNGLSPKPVSHPTQTKVLTLSATSSGVFRSECFKYVDLAVEKDSSLWIQDNDILIQRGNSLDYVGIAAVYRGNPASFIYPDLMMKVRMTRTIDTAFAHLVLNSPYGREYFKTNASGTSGSMPKVNQGTVRAFQFPLPPLAEQKRIVARVEELLALCDELEARQTAAREQRTRLVQSAFDHLTAATLPLPSRNSRTSPPPPTPSPPSAKPSSPSPSKDTSALSLTANGTRSNSGNSLR